MSSDLNTQTPTHTHILTPSSCTTEPSNCTDPNSTSTSTSTSKSFVFPSSIRLRHENSSTASFGSNIPPTPLKLNEDPHADYFSSSSSTASKTHTPLPVSSRSPQNLNTSNSINSNGDGSNYSNPNITTATPLSHKRNTSLFNSESTLVESNINEGMRRMSNNSETPTLFSSTHSNSTTESNERNGPFIFSIPPSPVDETHKVKSHSISLQRGLTSNLKPEGLGHRTTKSDSFRLSLPVKNHKKKPSTSLKDIEEQKPSNNIVSTVINKNPANKEDHYNPPSTAIDSIHRFSLSPKSVDFQLSSSYSTTVNPLESISTRNSSCESLSISNKTNHKRLGNSKLFKNLNSSNNKLKLPENVNLVDLNQCSDLIRDLSYEADESMNEVEKLPNLLIIDLRPFQDFSESHIINSINMCPPSILLKRPAFTLEKCINTLSKGEQKLFDKYLKKSVPKLPRVLFYDDNQITSEDVPFAIYHVMNKFLQFSVPNSNLFLLKDGFKQFKKIYPTLTNNLSNSNLLSLDSNKSLSSASINTNTFSPNSMQSPQSCISTESATRAKISTNGLSRFILPENLNVPVFKTRNYDEILSNSKEDSSMHLSNMLDVKDIQKLPKWLGNIYNGDNGSSYLTEHFNKLQIEEKNRLDMALNKKDTTNLKSTGDNPIISAGVELGNKNRYKDIFPYEHSRVLINNEDTSKPNSCESNYINASYLNFDTSMTKCNYIATQGPLNQTIGDFWKVVIDNKVPIIFSLTPQFENNVEKCAPFWNNGTYYSGQFRIEVHIEEEICIKNLKNSIGLISFRRILVKVFNEDNILQKENEILQIHMTTWPDFGIVICEDDLLRLSILKRSLMRSLHIENLPVLVHCSAGCGRTGSFCVIDSCLDILLNNRAYNPDFEFEFDYDLIFKITSIFRTQRVFMVQNLRQYILIYDSIIKFLLERNKECYYLGLFKWENNQDSGILQRFIDSYKLYN